MRRQFEAGALLGALLLQAGLPAHAADGTVAPVATVTSIAALGDSISRGFNACGFYRDCPERSWSTGADDEVLGHGTRLVSAGAPISARWNFARSGARVGELAGQAQAAREVGADYVTILIGANDVCRPTEAQMTEVPAFRASVDAALAILAASGTRVFIASIPDLKRLWAVGHGHRVVRYAWSHFEVCPTMLADPGSLDPAVAARRDRVRDRIIAFNGELAAACAAYGPLCRFDDYAVFGTRFGFERVSKWDFFHPNRAGQRLLAEVTWEQGQFAGLAQ